MIGSVDERLRGRFGLGGMAKGKQTDALELLPTSSCRRVHQVIFPIARSLLAEMGIRFLAAATT